VTEEDGEKSEDTGKCELKASNIAAGKMCLP
jgi:hypothetical protein